MPKKKYYVVWKGHQTGVFSTWDACKKNVLGYPSAQYKSFESKAIAERAFQGVYEDYKGKPSPKKELTAKEKARYGNPIEKSLAVDAACSGNPGKMEYRGVFVASGTEVFRVGPYEKGTNNIGEFLAIVHALAYFKKHRITDMPIYSDSKIAMNWIRLQKCRTKIPLATVNPKLANIVQRAETFLKNNLITTEILKWHTKVWGEIPADFGRK